MKIIRLLRFVVALPICGCLTNYYEQYYIDTVGQVKTAPSPGVQSVELKIATTEEDVLNLIEDGYASIGYSSFTGPYTPLSDLASVGADRLVHELLDGVECPGNGVGQCSLRGDFT